MRKLTIERRLDAETGKLYFALVEVSRNCECEIATSSDKEALFDALISELQDGQATVNFQEV